MELRTTVETAADKRQLIKVRFERESPDSDSPIIDVVYRIDYPLPLSIRKENVSVLTLVSITRTDTREAVTLTPEEAAIVHDAATTKAAETDW